jgi:beta-glucanase (GH16 family)
MRTFRNIALVLFFSFVATITQAQKRTYTKLVWQDNFSVNGLPDSAKWGYDIGTGCPRICGWGNNEAQYYTGARKENARVENGYLIIEARKEKFEGANYTSARLVTKNKGDWKYGRLVIRAQIPTGKGLWPAGWILPTDKVYGEWPKSGEVDILEAVGFAPDSAFGSVHTERYNGMIGTQRTASLIVPNLSTQFHDYEIEWTPEKIDFYIDNKLYNTFKNEHTGSGAWPFDQNFHLILNIAVGGNLGGKFGIDDAILPAQMKGDWVKVFQ